MNPADANKTELNPAGQKGAVENFSDACMRG